MEVVADMMSGGGCVGQEPLTVLVVDDEGDLAEALAEFLGDDGFHVVTATDGQTALDHLRRGLRPCAILLDLMMPRMNGWEFRREQLADQEIREIPVVVVTAAQLDAASRAQLGDVDLVAKPPSLPVLLAALRRHCGESAQ
jgi:two-component system, chemotaxis family, chemotaxis protein CheY